MSKLVMLDAHRSVGQQLADAQAAANILGRMAVLRDSRRKTNAALKFNAGSRLVAFSSAASSAQGDQISIYTSFDLPATGAVEYIRNLTPVTKDLFDGLSKQYQNDAFTISGVTDQNVLQHIRDVLGDVIQAGGTPADFRHAVAQLRSYEGVEKITAAELDNVFQGQTQKAYSAGRYEQMTDESVMEALPFWQFWTVGDDRVRPEHRVLNMFCAFAVDPVWRKIYPPCGYGCRCSVVCLTAEDAPDGSDESGIIRLPILAMEKVPQPGFQTILAA